MDALNKSKIGSNSDLLFISYRLAYIQYSFWSAAKMHEPHPAATISSSPACAATSV